ncbi:response regulator receiver protein [Pseudoxanthomonas suwonensis 11-1]|uniref:Response regulator receiver protein n=1 Tax=Pseudoxanthomonas suwonensis (strain 11-1) TaxID=743721 RepID=E6WTV3_PSEUU|nr:LytTR family DNA-binding domain-containing protein [Pseudoxanthomonas suwonensis]ADV27602.1 response regulator receiver protein [Pseudoxanthomonas suwonensis 11-1]
MPNQPLSYQRYLPWKPWVEAGLWTALILANFLGNSLTTLIDLRRLGAGSASWEPVVWEGSSALVWLLVLVPGVAWFTGRFPFYWHRLWRRLALYAVASVVLCLVHVLAMVGLRELAYAAMGADYDFGPWPRGLAYEYLKDARDFAAMVVLMEGYRFLMRRWQGEASLPGSGVEDDGPAAGPAPRPERFLVRKLGREFLVAIDEIEWLQASGNYVNLRVRGRDYPLRSTLARVEEQLDPGRFARIHRSHVVALSQVASIEPLDSGDARVHLKDGSVLPCSRRYRQALRERFDAQG